MNEKYLKYKKKYFELQHGGGELYSEIKKYLIKMMGNTTNPQVNNTVTIGSYKPVYFVSIPGKTKIYFVKVGEDSYNYRTESEVLNNTNTSGTVGNLNSLALTLYNNGFR